MRLLTILILTLSFQSFAKADDIRDFEIEGISIGDSLLNFTSEEKIKSIKAINQYPNDKFIIYNLDKLIKTTKYSQLSVTTKKNDKKYIISSLSGSIYYKNLNECLKNRKLIRSNVEKLIDYDDFEKTKYKSQDGKSTIHGVQFYLKPYPSVEAIVLNCKEYFKSGEDIRLSIAVNPEKYAYFLINEAY
tara:strand:+ start:60 stop:626 length:567 start_codon:yes stop_codon:yes gene_type:complete